MEFDQKRAVRVDLKRRREKDDTRSIKRQLQTREWDEDDDQDEDLNELRRRNQYRK
jgi:hypothetical protein